MHSYLFFLGQTTDLCLAELQAVLRRWQLPSAELVTETVAVLHTEEAIDAPALQEILGGTVKIAQAVEALSLEQQEQVEPKILDILRDRRPKRFVIAEHGRDHLPVVYAEGIKRELARDGIKASYKQAPRSGANAALLKSSKALEVHVFQTNEGIVLATTEGVQDVDVWSLRDVGKPQRDTKRGLLQPKIAHMMLNLAIGEREPKEQVVLDPFCGSGTVLIEATMLDVPTVLGSDVAAEAVDQTRENLAWWQEQLVEKFSAQAVVSQVERLVPADFSAQPTVIVTEPFLGKLTPKEEELPGLIRGLEKLYRGMFRAFHRVLPEGGRVAILFPAYQVGKRTLTVSNTLQDAPKLGFTLVEGPYRAGRPEAVTQRNVYVFEKQTPTVTMSV